MDISIPKHDYEEHLSYYMEMNEDKLIEKYYEKTRKLNKKLGYNEISSFYARQEIYEIEQALKKRNIFNKIKTRI